MEIALVRRKAKLQLEDHLLLRAAALYRQGFHSLSAAQMAAVSQHLQTAPDHAKAKKSLKDFLKKQLEKLEDGEGVWRPESWGKPVETGEARSLGETLMDCISHERYLEGNPPGVSEVDRLTALRFFWAGVHTLYRYCQAFPEEDLPF
jgi:hypothetical protein